MSRIVKGQANLDIVAKAVTEAELQSWVLEFCTVLGLLAFHSGDSRRDSSAGLPDLVIVGSRGVIYRELKTMRGHLRVEQQRWISRLQRAGADAAVWKPTAWFDDRIARELKAIR